ncbi:hypothetical protein PU629_18480 [Pullulanibacillus sp. KACC 23026]|uniref:hypothetical protein n=1 Tax=Pullulanibacillus sp. KACC 23026 TaxID=3028315 RepID=UPI0023AFD681|nr:hypothetical protein [Pullulanibacillus sp. KACC 23026]WEG12087.1 hypothetical protein PU629_18480 [Pullulanibacillus sp. KACC 23026]
MEANSEFSLRSKEIGVTAFRYFGIPAEFAADSVFSLRSIEIGVTPFPYFDISAQFRVG